jgi:hypothetical protein
MRFSDERGIGKEIIWLDSRQTKYAADHRLEGLGRKFSLTLNIQRNDGSRAFNLLKKGRGNRNDIIQQGAL